MIFRTSLSIRPLMIRLTESCSPWIVLLLFFWPDLGWIFGWKVSSWMDFSYSTSEDFLSLFFSKDLSFAILYKISERRLPAWVFRGLYCSGWISLLLSSRRLCWAKHFVFLCLLFERLAARVLLLWEMQGVKGKSYSSCRVLVLPFIYRRVYRRSAYFLDKCPYFGCSSSFFLMFSILATKMIRTPLVCPFCDSSCQREDTESLGDGS